MRTHGGGLIQVFNLFIPRPVDPDLVPPAIMEQITADPPGQDLKWYAAGPAPGGAFTAIDYRTEDPPGRFLRLTLWGDGAFSSGVPLSRVAEVTIPVQFDVPFGCSGLGKIPKEAAGRAPSAAEQAEGLTSTSTAGEGAAAGGWAWDQRVVEVAGKTLEGQVVRARTVNGCWLLVAGSAGITGWREFRALDERGKVMYGREMQDVE